MFLKTFVLKRAQAILAWTEIGSEHPGLDLGAWRGEPHTGVPRSEETPTPLGSPQVPRHRATVGSYGGWCFLWGGTPVPTVSLISSRGGGSPGKQNLARSKCTHAAEYEILYEKSLNLKTISQGDFGHFREKNQSTRFYMKRVLI